MSIEDVLANNFISYIKREIQFLHIKYKKSVKDLTVIGFEEQGFNFEKLGHIYELSEYGDPLAKKFCREINIAKKEIFNKHSGYNALKEIYNYINNDEDNNELTNRFTLGKLSEEEYNKLLTKPSLLLKPIYKMNKLDKE